MILTPTFGNVGVNTTPWSITVPTGVLANTFVAIFIKAAGQPTSSTDPAPASAGFGSVTGTTGGTISDLQISGLGYWTCVLGKLAVGADSGTYSVTFPNGTAGDWMCMASTGRSGGVTFVDQTTNYGVAFSAGTVTLAMNGGTPAVGDDLFEYNGVVLTGTVGTESFTASAGWSNAAIVNTNEGSCCQTLQNSSGTATGTIAGVYADSTATNFYARGIVLSLAATSGAPTGTPHIPRLGIAMAPLAWIIRRRQRLAIDKRRAWRRDARSGLILPESKIVAA